ncbi:MFS transporter [Streptomyces sp. R11]|uniref:MFS transporter n=1 Tax=Streptomyces sp. R11 TaxID=3238625 RepID=A0AB39NDK6_9ACTN
MPVQSLVPRLPPAAWRILGADALSAVGTGLTLPFLMVYLHTVCGFAVEVAGSVLATFGLVSLVGNPLGGWLSDRCGPQRPLVAGLALSALGTAGWAVVSQPWHAFTAATIAALGISVCWPAQSALLASVVETHQRTSVFSVGHMTLNMGLGTGALIAALLVDPRQLGTFTLLYLLDAVTFLAAAGIVALGAPLSGAGSTRGPQEGAALRDRQSGYRHVVRDGVLVLLWLITALLVTAGFAQFHIAIPIVAVEAGVPAHRLGMIFAVNTIGVVVFQLVALRMVRSRRRTRVAMILAVLWAMCWCIVILAVRLPPGPLVLATLLTASAVFALGEVLLAPTLPALVNDIAPERLRGRYNGAHTLAYTVGFVVGPLLSASALGNGETVLLLVGLTSVCLATVPLIYVLERRLNPAVNLTPGRLAGSDISDDDPNVSTPAR